LRIYYNGEEGECRERMVMKGEGEEEEVDAPFIFCGTL